LGSLRVLSGSEVCRILEQHGFAAVSKAATALCKSVGRLDDDRSCSAPRSGPTWNPAEHHSAVGTPEVVV
jgi:hypothetical protein